jgi:hypothetical protein
VGRCAAAQAICVKLYGRIELRRPESDVMESADRALGSIHPFLLLTPLLLRGGWGVMMEH